VRVLLQRALDNRRVPDAGRTIAEAGNDVRLQPAPVEERSHTPNDLAEGLLAIRFELYVNGDVHPATVSDALPLVVNGIESP